MASYLINNIAHAYRDLMENKSDPRTRHWFMIESPIPTIGLVLSYIIFVKKIGPNLMKERPAFELSKIMIAYNFLHAISSAYIFYLGSVFGWLTSYSFRCQPTNYDTDPDTVMMLYINWWFFMSRFIEFVDTIFFILRKKNNQVSTLHVVHHSTVPIIAWLGMKFVPAGHYTFAGYINVFVHIFMYFYYMLAAMGPQMKKHLWWKKYLTILQLAQFLLVLIHTTQTVFSDCAVPKSFAFVIGLQAVLFFCLFFNFYKAQYIKATTEAKKFGLRITYIHNKISKDLFEMCIPNQELLYSDPEETYKQNTGVNKRSKIEVCPVNKNL